MSNKSRFQESKEKALKDLSKNAFCIENECDMYIDYDKAVLIVESIQESETHKVKDEKIKYYEDKVAELNELVEKLTRLDKSKENHLRTCEKALQEKDIIIRYLEDKVYDARN